MNKESELCAGTMMCCYKLTRTSDDFVLTSHSFNRCQSEEKHSIGILKIFNKHIVQATPHPHRLLVGDPDEGVPPREKLHARVTQVILK